MASNLLAMASNLVASGGCRGPEASNRWPETTEPLLEKAGKRCRTRAHKTREPRRDRRFSSFVRLEIARGAKQIRRPILVINRSLNGSYVIVVSHAFPFFTHACSLRCGALPWNINHCWCPYVLYNKCEIFSLPFIELTRSFSRT